MPIYIQFDGIQGSVKPAGLPAGGVWKTSNFLTREAAINRPKVKTFICPSDPGVVEISRISMTPSGGGVEGRDASARFKVEQLINQARSHGPSGKLYIATDAGVYASANNRGQLLVGIDKARISGIDQHGRLLVGTDQGVWRSGGVQEAANKMKSANNLKQLGLGCHNGTVDIIVTDASGMVVGTHRLNNASVSSAQAADSTPQRSRVTSLTVTFDRATTF